MSNDRFDGELHAWIEPEIEARLVALILGEASPFEAEELERMMQERPELRIFKRRLEVVHSLMGEAVKPPDAEKWRMVAERRAEVMKALGIEPPEEPAVVPIDAGRERRVRRAGLRVAMMAAACFLISLVLAPFLLRGVKSGMDSKESQSVDVDLVSYSMDSAESAAPATMEPGYGGRMLNGPASGEGKSSLGDKLAALKQNMGTGVAFDGAVDADIEVASGVFASGGNSDGSVHLERLPDRRGIDLAGGAAIEGNTVTRRTPAKPSSSMSKAIAATTPAAPAIPVPDVPVPEPSVDFGTGDDFGEGWGTGSGGGSFGNGRVSGREKQSVKKALGELADQIPQDMPAEAPVASAKPSPKPAPVKMPSVVSGKRTDSRQKGVPEVENVPAMGRMFAAKANKEAPDAPMGTTGLGTEIDQNGDVAAHWKRERNERESRGGDGVDRQNPGQGSGPFGVDYRGYTEAATDEGRKMQTKTKSLDAKPANGDDVYFQRSAEPTKGRNLKGQKPGAAGFAFWVDDAVEKADVEDLFVSGNEGGFVTGGAKPGDAPTTMDGIDAERSDPDPYSPAGTLSVSGLVSGDREQENTRGLARAKKKPAAFEAAKSGVVLESDSMTRSRGRGEAVDLAIKPDVREFNGFIDYGAPVRGQAAKDVSRLQGRIDSLQTDRDEAEAKLDVINGGARGDLTFRHSVGGEMYKRETVAERLEEELEEVSRKLVLSDGDGLALEYESESDYAKRAQSPEDKAAWSWFSKEMDQDGRQTNFDVADPTNRPDNGRSDRMKNEGGVATGPDVAFEGQLNYVVGGSELGRPADLQQDGEVEVGIVEREQLRRANQTAAAETGLREGREAEAKEEWDYRRASNDGTRARKLAEVDKSWEAPVPPVPEDQEKAGEGQVVKSGVERRELRTQKWSVPQNFVKDLEGLGADEFARGEGSDDPFAPDAGGGLGGGLEARRPVVDVLKDRGIVLPKGATATYLRGTNELVVTSSADDLKLMNEIVEKIGEGSPPVDYMGLYEPPTEEDRTWGEDPEDLLVKEKLKNLVVPEVDFEDVTVEEAVDFLRQRSAELDAVELGARGVDFAIRKARVEFPGADAELDAEAGLGAGDPGAATIKDLKLRNVPMATVLQYVADQAGLRYKVEGGRVTLMPQTGGEGDEPLTRRWKVHPDVIAELRSDMMDNAHDEDDPFAPAEDRARNSLEHTMAQMTDRKELIEMLKDVGISFPPGASVIYLPDSQSLVVKNTPSNLDLVDVLMEQVAASLASERQAKKTNEKHASQEAFSTFSLHVSDVSFKLAQAALAKGEWPEAARVRVEEFVNAFDYGDPAPSQDEKVACALEQAAHPFMQQRNMLRIAMRTAAVGRAAGTPLRLTVLLDNSGSMERADREESVKRAFRLLAAQMNPQDEVTLISFARKPRLMRDSVPGNQMGDLVRLLEDTPSEGGTNLEEALRLGMEKAQEDFLEGAQNRIILLTDGAANLGNAEPELLGEMVEKMRQKGIAFDACGVGAEGLNDDVLEALTRKGDGRYYFLDRPEDADAGFAKQIAGALRPAAKNVKVQVEFNPKRVGHYRLYGFEKHELKKEDFRDDKVDAAEMAAEEAGVAMYQVETLPDGEGDVGSVSVRFMDMATGEMVEKRWAIPYEPNPASLEDAAPSMKLAASAAFLGEKLKGTSVGDLVELGDLSGVSRSLQPIFPSDARVVQLIDMIEKAREMAR